MAEKQFEKTSMGVSLETGFFSADGMAGFNVSSYAGRLNFKFWKKDEKSSDNRDNTCSINPNQVMVLNNVLKYIIQSRHAAYVNGGVEAYSDITNLYMTIDGVVNGAPVVFAVIRFDTVEIDGIKRVQMTITRNATVNTIVFYDKFLKNTLPDGMPFKIGYDVLDTSFIRFCTEINQWLIFSWNQGAFNKLYSTVKPAASNGGNSGYSGGNKGGYNKPAYGGGNKPSRTVDEDFGAGSLFDEDDF